MGVPTSSPNCEIVVSSFLFIILVVTRDIAAGLPVDNAMLVHFFCSCQLVVRELHKSYRLITKKPLDMSSFYGKYSMDTSSQLDVNSNLIFTTF